MPANLCKNWAGPKRSWRNSSHEAGIHWVGGDLLAGSPRPTSAAASRGESCSCLLFIGPGAHVNVHMPYNERTCPFALSHPPALLLRCPEREATPASSPPGRLMKSVPVGTLVENLRPRRGGPSKALVGTPLHRDWGGPESPNPLSELPRRDFTILIPAKFLWTSMI